MSNTITRRRILAAAPAAIAAISIPHSAAIAATVGADAELLAAGSEHARIAALIDREIKAGDVSSDAYDALRSAPSEATLYRDSDAALGLSKPGWWRVPGIEFVENRDGRYNSSNLWELNRLRERRAIIPGYPESHPKFGQPIPDGEPVGEFMVGHVLLVRTAPAAPEVVARVDEIIAALNADHADYERVMIESGVRTHEDELTRLNKLLEPSLRVLVETPATTINGIMTKVAAAVWSDHEDDPSQPLSYDLDEMAMGRHSLLAWSIIRDLAAGGVAPHG